MKENAAIKARRTVIGRTLGGRATLKSLLDYLKLHLPVPFISITLLMKILLEEEESAKATRRLTAVEWSGLSLSFSRYAPNFDASSQGAEAQLTHAIKVQFPDLHEEFKNTRALILMASKLGEVLEIEAADSYIKRPTGPMVTIELKDISKLSGYIRIPSMAKGTENTVTIAQKILYSGLPNQCRKCRRFGHHARACIISKNKPWEGAPTPNPSRGESEKKPRGAGAPCPSNEQPGKQLRAKIAKKSQERAGKSLQKDISESLDSDQTMAKPTSSPPGPKQDKQGTIAESRPKSPPLEQPIFGYRSEASLQTHLLATGTNPFTALESINPEEEDLNRTQEESGEGWTFQASKRQVARHASTGKAPPSSPTRTPTQDHASGNRRKRSRSEVHISYFTSLGMSVPPGQEFARARIWPILSRERDNQKEILVNVKNNDPPHLPLHIRCTSASEEEWTPASALEDLTRSVESELEEKVLRFNLSLKGRFTLEWGWQEDQAKGGWECTILAHINSGLSEISAQKRKNLHWRAFESITSMNNDVIFTGPAHSLLLKTGPASTD
ncbi:unnamed protein product [Sphagnum balticum]